jgi:hypothetical protein
VPRAFKHNGVWMKPCTKCGAQFVRNSLEFLILDFSVRAASFDGLHSWCRDCSNAWHTERKERLRNRLLARQAGCWICGGDFGDSVAEIDHCHVTGKVRGLLCRACNAKLGKLEANYRVRSSMWWRASAELYLAGSKLEAAA